MMNTILAKELIKELPIGLCDAVRLVVECVEELGERFRCRADLMRKVRRVFREGVRTVQQAEHTEYFEKAAWASIEARAARRPTTRRDLRYYVRRMLRVQGVAAMPLRRMSAEDCRLLLHKAFGHSVSSYRKARAILHSIFAYGIRREWCDANPIDRIENPPVREKTIRPLTPAEVARLEAVATRPEHAPMRFSLYLMLYCGLRPHEVRRLRPEDVRLSEQELIIRPGVSKTGGGRVVPLRKKLPAGAWLIPGCWEQRWRALRRAAGFEHWQADACRHSFASYHAAYYRNLPALQCEMGHSNLRLLHTCYISPVSKRAARQFWHAR